MFAAALVPLLAALQQPQVRDSVDAIALLRATIEAHYHWVDRAGFWPQATFVWSPPPRRTSGPCRGVSFDECFGGDWSCRARIDCTHPKQSERLAALIDAVEQLAPLAGGSELVFRQRVALADKNHEYERAYRIANSCFGTDWWCMALRGFAEHRLRPGAGLPSFDSALAIAPHALRCAWLDLVLVDPRAESTGLPASCSMSDPALRLYWWLADPLWSRDGNERFADHLARHVMEAMERDLWTIDGCRYIAEGYPNSRRLHIVQFTPRIDAHATAVRAQCLNQPVYGQEVRTRDRVRMYAEFRYVHGGYGFAPDSARFHDPLSSTSEDWGLTWDRGDERLVTREHFHNLHHQTAVFRRGPQLLVVAAAPLPPPLDTAARLEPFLALGRVGDLSVVSERARIDDARVFRGSVRVDSGAYLASVEVVGERAIGRARHGAPAPPLVDGFGVSDIALVDERFEADSTNLAEALLPTPTIPRRGRVGVYFEVYGVAEDESLDVGISAEQLGRSLVRRVLGVFGRGSSAPLRVTWQESAEPTSGLALRRFLLLDAATLPVGRQRVLLTVRRANGATASIARLVEVR